MANQVTHDEDDVIMVADEDNHVYAGSRLDLDPQAAGLKLTGINPSGRADDGTEFVIVNVNPTNSVTLAHNNAGSSVGNRLFFHDNVDHVLAPFEMVWGLRMETEAGRVGWWLQF